MDLSSFIREHREEDVRELALRARLYGDVDVAAALVQIDGWQRARRKLPMWAEREGIVYPVHLSMEQCSSERTARYKASIVEGGECMTDLTAGFGVDAAMMGRRYGHLTFVERNEELCSIARNNLPLLGVERFEVVCDRAEDVLERLPHQNLIYIDPARRDVHGGRVVSIADCTPDVHLLQERLRERADEVMVKLSPMLDLRGMERELTGVREVHVVSVDNECKEVLVRMSVCEGEGRIVCVNLREGKGDTVFSFTRSEEAAAVCGYTDEVEGYVYEPDASIMKAGCFRCVGQRFGLRKLHPNSHLYTSGEQVVDFPGRSFRVLSVLPLNLRKGRGIGVEHANVAVRNFPMSVAELRKRLKLREGGDKYVFATTLADGRRVLLVCEKAG